MATNEERLQKMLDAASEGGIQRDDVALVFRALIKRMNEMREFFDTRFTTLTNMVNQKISDMQALRDEMSGHISSTQTLLGTAKDHTENLENILSKIQNKAGLFDRLASLVPQRNDVISKNINALGARISLVQDSIPDTDDLENRVGALESKPEQELEGEEIATELESLEGDDRLDISAIKGFDERIKSYVDKLDERIGRMSGLIVAQQRGAVRAYDLSSKLDGVTVTFTLPAFGVILLITLSSFPNTLRQGIDYTVNYSKMQITFVGIDASTILSAGQTCIILYAEN